MGLNEQSPLIPVDAYNPKHNLEPSGHESHLSNQTGLVSVDSDTEMKERQLVHALCKGDEGAFSTLIERYHGRLLRLAKTFVTSQAVAEEVVQDTWLAVLQSIAQLKGRCSLKAWIFQILTNRAKTKGKREHRYVSFSEVSSLTDQEMDVANEPERFNTSGPLTWEANTSERYLLSKESQAQIEKVIQTLPSNQGPVIILRDIEGLHSEEICHILNITPTNLRVLLNRARSNIRTVLVEYLKGF